MPLQVEIWRGLNIVDGQLILDALDNEVPFIASSKLGHEFDLKYQAFREYELQV